MVRRGFAGAMMRVTQAREHHAIVTKLETITPHFLRVHLRCQGLFEDIEYGPAAWIRAWFPDHTGKNFEHQRSYTLSSENPETGDFTIDFVLHEPVGPASVWAKSCTVGAELTVMSLGSSRFEVPADAPAGYLLIGDAAAIPGLARIITAIPEEAAIELYLEEHNPSDRDIPLPSHPGMRTHWVPRRGRDSLAAALEARDWSNWYAWATPESATLKRLRLRLRDEFGFPKQAVHALAYWVEGRAMGKQRDLGENADTASVPEFVSRTVSAESREPAESVGQPADSVNSASSASEAVDKGVVSGETVHATKRVAKGTWRAAAASRLLAPLRPVFWVAGIVQAIVTLLELMPYVLLTELARRLLAGADAAELWPLGIGAVVLLGVGTLLGVALLLCLHLVDARSARTLRTRLLEKFTRIPLGWFDAQGSSQVKRVVQDDTLALHYLVTHAIPDAVAAVVAPLAVLGYLFVVDWRLALLLFIPVLSYLLAMYVMVLRSYDTIPKVAKWASRMDAEAGAYLEAQPEIRVFGGAQRSMFYTRLGEYIGFLERWQRPFIALKTLMDLVTRPATFLLLIVVFGSVWIVAGVMDPLAVLPFLLLGTSFGSRLLGIGFGLTGLKEGVLAAQRAQLLLETKELSRDEDQPVPCGSESDPAGTPTTSVAAPAAALPDEAARQLPVCFNGVSFSYQQGTRVLRDVSLELRAGTVTALVGRSGSGKSTLAALLARFYDLDAGQICIDGTDIRSLTNEDLYRLVGFVFQEPQVIAATVRENIALADPRASFERVVAAAQAANIHDRIRQLPEGYDTLLGGSRGAGLSGGERQRLMIARAMLADTPVLVLDEATAFVDPESEYLVQQALARLAAGRTVLVIAHRLRTIVDVDQIVVLVDGEVAEQGTHAQLLAAGGAYRALWDAAPVQFNDEAQEADEAQEVSR